MNANNATPHKVGTSNNSELTGTQTWSLRRRGRRRQMFSREMRLRARIDAIREGAQLDHDEARRGVTLKHAQLAADALDLDQFERAWINILHGERLVLESQNDEQLLARASALAAEAAAVLPAAEAKPTLDLLAPVTTGQNRPQDWRATVIEAQSLFERRVIFLNDTRERTSTRIKILVWTMIFFIVAFVVLVSWSRDLLISLYGTAPPPPMSLSMLFATLFLGGLGACLSALLSFTSLGRPPAPYESLAVTFARPLVGAASGLIAVMLVRASLVEFKTTAAIGLVAFLFGFSERLVLGAVQRLEAAQNPKLL